MKGSCLCGTVRFEITGQVRDVVGCHCKQCRKQSGHHWAASSVRLDEIDIEGAEHITWYDASPDARRGFCSECGSHLFWHPTGQDRYAFSPGAIDGPTGLKMKNHVFVADKGDYYDIKDGLPQYAQYKGDESA